MPVTTKEVVLKQVAECRRRLNLLLELRNDVSSSIDAMCHRVTNDVAAAENLAEVGDDANVACMIKKFENSQVVLQAYGNVIEGVRSVHEDAERELCAVNSRLDKLTGPQRTSSGLTLASNQTTDQTEIGNSSRVNANNSGSSELIQACGGSEAAVMDDSRKRIVSKGNGNHFCQSSVDLNASQTTVLPCLVSHVDSPSLFWIQLLHNSVERIEDELNEALDVEAKPLACPNVGDYCAAPSADDEDSHRAKILEIKQNKRGIQCAKILYIDNGKVEWVATDALLEMPSRVKHFNRQACPCSLAELEPVSGSWSDEIIAEFRRLCVSDDGPTFLGVKSLDQADAPEINTIFLYRVSKETSSEPRNIIMSLILWGATKRLLRRADQQVPMRGFEKESGEPIGNADPPDFDNGDWRCKVRFCEQKPPASTDADRTGTSSTTGQSGLVSVENTASAPVSSPTRQSKVVQGERVEALSVPSIAASNDGSFYFFVRRANSPGDFSIQLCDRYGRNNNLEQLTSDMNDFYNAASNRLILAKPQSQYAVIRWTMNGRTAYRRLIVSGWRFCGGSSRDVRVNSKVSANFIDEGFQQDLETRNLYMLDKRFCALPAQSVWCKLFDCSPLQWDDGDWSQQAFDTFKDLCKGGMALMRGLLMNNTEPYEIVAYRQEDEGETCVNGEMVKSGTTGSNDNVEW